MQADHPVGCIFDNQFHQGAFGAATQRVLERLEVTAVNGDLAEFFDGIGLGVADRADVRVGEHRRRNELVAHAARLFAFGRTEQLVDHHHRLAQGHRRELHPGRHVADGVNGWHRGLVLRVHLDCPGCVLRDAGRLQAQVRHQRHPAGRIQHGVHGDTAAVDQLDLQAFAGAFDGGDVGVQVQGHAAFDHFAGNEGAHFLVKAAQHLVAPVELRDLRAQPIKDRRKLAGNVAAADHQEALREGRQVEHFVRADDMRAAGKLGNAGLAAGRNQNVFGAVALATHFHRVCIDQRRPAIDDLDTRAFEQLRVNRVKA